MPDNAAHDCSEELIILKQKALNFEPLYSIKDEETFHQLVYELAYDRKKLAAVRDFTECEKHNQAINYVNDCCEEWKIQARSKQSHKRKEKLKIQVEKNLEEFDKETNRMTLDLCQEIEEERSNLEHRQQNEIKEMENQWLQKKSNDFNHPSRELLNMERVIQDLLTQCRFEEAKRVQKERDLLKDETTKNNYQRWQHAYNAALLQLIEKQKQTLDTFDKLAQLRKDNLMMSRSKERESIEKRFKKIDAPNVTSSFRNVYSTIKESKPFPPSVTIHRNDFMPNEPDLLKLPQLDLRRNIVEKAKLNRKAEL